MKKNIYNNHKYWINWINIFITWNLFWTDRSFFKPSGISCSLRSKAAVDALRIFCWAKRLTFYFYFFFIFYIYIKILIKLINFINKYKQIIAYLAQTKLYNIDNKYKTIIILLYDLVRPFIQNISIIYTRDLIFIWKESSLSYYIWLK